MDRPPARKQHLHGKNALVALALFEPLRFVALCASDAAAAQLAEFWESCGEGLGPDERCDSAGLSALVRGPADGPIVVVTLPVPERPNEAFFIEAVPVDSPELRFRVFGLEKTVFPKTGEPLTFVVEWDGSTRCNYGPPTDEQPNAASVGALAGAILDIVEGKRKPLARGELRLPRPESKREQGTQDS